jgi:hypothetical protein
MAPRRVALLCDATKAIVAAFLGLEGVTGKKAVDSGAMTVKN